MQALRLVLQRPLLFDPSSSSTYRSISCDSVYFSALMQSGCSSGSQCQYNYAYDDQSYVIRYLATETLSFDTDRSGCQVQVPNILFGCTHKSNDTFDVGNAGLIRFSCSQLSLITQLGDAIDNKFSYCLLPLETNFSIGLLKFGSDAVIYDPKAVSTRIIRNDPDTFFFLNLEQITIGEDNSLVISVRPPGAYPTADTLWAAATSSSTPARH